MDRPILTKCSSLSLRSSRKRQSLHTLQQHHWGKLQLLCRRRLAQRKGQLASQDQSLALGSQSRRLRRHRQRGSKPHNWALSNRQGLPWSSLPKVGQAQIGSVPGSQGRRLGSGLTREPIWKQHPGVSSKRPLRKPRHQQTASRVKPRRRQKIALKAGGHNCKTRRMPALALHRPSSQHQVSVGLYPMQAVCCLTTPLTCTFIWSALHSFSVQ